MTIKKAMATFAAVVLFTSSRRNRKKKTNMWFPQIAGPLLCLIGLLIIPVQAGAKSDRQDLSRVVTQFCGERVCGIVDQKIAYRHGGRMLVEKRQQYVKPKIDANGMPLEKLVTREVYEATNAGLVISHKTGAKAHVSPKYAAAFQAFINDLENNHGSTIKFMGGYRKGPCHQGSKHPCGMALDYCQYARGIVDQRCNLPGRVIVAQVAKAHGLFEGGQWCNSDYGHVEAGGSASCGHNIYAAVAKFKAPYVR